MKVFALIVLAACTFTAQAFTEADLDDTDRFCLQKLGYEKSVVIDSYDQNELIKEGNDKMNTFFECAWQKDGLTNSDGSVNYDALSTYVEKKVEVVYPGKDGQNLAIQGVNACKDVRGSGSGDTYVKVYNCLYTKIAELAA